VALEGVSGRLGFAFRDRMRNRIGDAGPAAPYRLDVALSFSQEGLLISRRDDVTRFDVEGLARYTLRRRADGETVAEGVARSVSAYSTLASPYATRVAERDAERRVAEDLAERVFARIAALPVRGPADAPFPPDPEA
jgi:LPS-assembly lipoprotein